jgi:hypothetical protein
MASFNFEAVPPVPPATSPQSKTLALMKMKSKLTPARFQLQQSQQEIKSSSA